MAVQVDDNQAFFPSAAIEHRHDDAQHRARRNFDAAVLHIEVEPGNVNFISSQPRPCDDIAASGLVLQIGGGGAGRLPVSVIDPDDFTAMGPDEANLIVDAVVTGKPFEFGCQVGPLADGVHVVGSLVGKQLGIPDHLRQIAEQRRPDRIQRFRCALFPLLTFVGPVGEMDDGPAGDQRNGESDKKERGGDERLPPGGRAEPAADAGFGRIPKQARHRPFYVVEQGTPAAGYFAEICRGEFHWFVLVFINYRAALMGIRIP